MTNRKKKSDLRNAPALSLTKAQFAVYKIVHSRHFKGLVTKNSDVVRAWQNKDRSYVCQVLNALIEKNLVARYNRMYYKIAH